MATSDPEIQKYKNYIHQHALKYVPPAPDRNDAHFPQWLQKLQKVEDVLHKKYMKKLARTLEQQTQILNAATPQKESCQNICSFPNTNKVLPSPLKAYDDYFGFDGLLTPGSDAPKSQPQPLPPTNSLEYGLKISEFEQNNGRQTQIIDRLLMQQQQLNSTKDNLQRIVVNQLNEISKLSQKYEENEVLVAALRNKNEQMMQEYERLDAVYKQTMEEHKELETKYIALKQVEDEKERESNPEIFDTLQTVKWIISLDKQRYGKYYDVLLKNMQKEGIDGDCLHDLCKDDLYRLGIVQFKDKRDIMQSIRQFVKSKEDDIKETTSIL